jgi:hypothetical protein
MLLPPRQETQKTGLAAAREKINKKLLIAFQTRKGAEANFRTMLNAVECHHVC